jgi:hypothetical protein
MPGWWDEIVWVGSLNAPVEGRLEVDLSQFDSETPKPRKALWTCTRIPTLVSPWLESSEKQFRGPEKIWKLTVSEKARVAEIHSAAAWFRFVRAYMRDQVGYTYSTMLHRPQSAARVDPDWSKVALDWDGVHLSVGGWLTAEDVTYESDRVTTELRGWNMESTVWFRWAFTAVEPIEMAT